jgi:sugar lactone lactonase YvrE
MRAGAAQTIGVVVVCLVLLLTPFASTRATGAGVAVLAHGFGAPDDLAWGPHGSIYFSDFGDDAVNGLDPDGRITVVWQGLRGPEGIVVEPDGSLVVAEQVPNRVLRLNLARHTEHIVGTIPNPSGRLGIDGVARDPGDGSIIVPDSPSGTVLRITASGRVRAIATGLGRPVGALVLPNHSIVVVDEQRNGVFRISPAGDVHQFAGFLSVPDDVVSDGRGGYYISCLGDGTIRHVAADGTTSVVAASLSSPQGLLRRTDGTLIVAEESANRIVALRP